MSADNETHVGFTGTQRGMTAEQFHLVRKALNLWRMTLRDEGKNTFWFHHGDCVGADSQAAEIAREEGWLLHGHPCNIKDKRANVECDRTEEPLPPLTRNIVIVERTVQLLAAPWEELEKLRSGTWATIRYARRLERPVMIVKPNGQLS